ncbi:acyltransferase family protein [Flavobacterium sp. 7A]|uniref:acyltransferase family protein n=1 Tax=Flavobacterium sp. 7A TaxID=2940571 RepID=UPI002226457B|nr:acyltransferase [Flavobacterium sp. 7A]MCW2118494.1 peptidoglycan/LPS O-acetylase OafA/YrhL [Flavobacterium sp. 7A]
MDTKKSLFLDFVRIFAALLVVYGHAVMMFFGDIEGDRLIVSNMRHFAVVLFFVLSGYVIGFTTKSNNRGAQQYAVARLSRLYSMVLPALVISFIIEMILNYIALKNIHVDVISVVRYLITATFMNELWLFSSAPRINVVLWSVSFEFFFYLIFGVYLYTKDKKKKVLFTILACLFAGPKILLMFPIWIAGYLAFIYDDKLARFKNSFTFLLFLFFTFASYVALEPLPYVIGYKPLYFANQFCTDLISGILFAVTIFLFPTNLQMTISDKFVKQFRTVADFTFPIYVLHYPILQLCKVVLNNAGDMQLQFYVSILVSLFFSVVFGYFFNKYRILWTTLFEKIFNRYNFISINK